MLTAVPSRPRTALPGRCHHLVVPATLTRCGRTADDDLHDALGLPAGHIGPHPFTPDPADPDAAVVVEGPSGPDDVIA